jgi:UDP-N-acetylmuramate dehydrogenase
MNWWQDLKGRIERNAPLKAYTTFKIGGPVKFFIEPKDTADLKLLLRLLKSYKITFLVIGRGSNILVSDKGLNAAVIRLSSSHFKKVRRKNGSFELGSGLALKKAVIVAEKNNLSGMEFLAGIPGTVGGALAMNAGVAKENIGSLVKYVEVIDDKGNIKRLHHKDLRFGNRTSNLGKYIILSACFRLRKQDKKKIKEKMRAYFNYRYKTQDLDWPSAGCVFKNPKKYSAGKLIDLCGLKGRMAGGARISFKHANFILNVSNAKAKDIFRLMSLIRRKVKNKFNINLKPEIKIWQ